MPPVDSAIEARPAAVVQPSRERFARNILLLASCQALAQAGNTIMLTVTAIAALSLTSWREWSTFPITMQHIGVMLSVFPAALLMQRYGRKFGFRIGSVVGMAGGALCAAGILLSSLALLSFAGLVLGYAIANMQMYRFAAVELGPAALRAKAISYVTAGGVAAGILGPGIAWATPDLLPVTYLATYIAFIGLHGVSFVLLSLIDFPPVVEEKVKGPARPLLQIASQPAYIVAVLTATIAFGTMSFLMVASPLAIVACGLGKEEAPITIFLHVMGMFVPAFFTGHLIQRYGVFAVMIAGAALMYAGIVVDLAGLNAWNFRIGLAANGIGWNFMFVGATTLVTTTYTAAERGKAQALNDFLVFGTMAVMSFLTSQLHERYGWDLINHVATAMITVATVAVLALWIARRQPPRPASA